MIFYSFPNDLCTYRESESAWDLKSQGSGSWGRMEVAR